VLTTSRAPLAIAAERVYPLGELGSADAVRLFGERALAARPDARLDEQVVEGIVRSSTACRWRSNWPPPRSG